MSTKKLTQEQFVDRCKKIHGIKFDYSLATYVNATTKVTISCNKCKHVWNVTPNNFLNNAKSSGCPNCKRIKQIGRDTKTTADFIKSIKHYHGEKFLYDRLVYVNCNTKVTVGCKVHGYFEKWPNDLKNGSGCPRCSGNKVDYTEFINEMSLKHPNFDFSKFIYSTAKTKSTVICKKHGEFLQSPNTLKTTKSNYGCPACGKEHQLTTLINKGKIRNPDKIDEYEKYRKDVWKISNRQFNEHYYKINPDNIKRGPNYHLDHKYSIQQGWQNNIAPHIIGGWKNLQLLPAKQNRQKSNKCTVLIDDIV